MVSGEYRTADVDVFVARVVPLIVSGQRTIAQLTASYLGQVTAFHSGGKAVAEAVNFALVTGDALRGVPLVKVYRRPAVALYTALSEGKPFRQAVDLGLARAQDIAATDLQLAKTHTVAASKRIVFYKRTLSGLENCDLCPLAAQNHYSRGDLMPIHPHCDCGIMPIFSKRDFPEPVESDRQIAVRQHGEIGPVLTWADQNFTSTADLPSH